MPQHRKAVNGISCKTPGNSPRRVELSLGKDNVNRTYAPSNNGIRPHGGYRGTKEHPPTMFSLLTAPGEMPRAEVVSRPRSPAWAINVAAEKNHSGESPLFVHKLLAPSKEEYQEDEERSEVLHQIGQQRRPMSSRYYRPNSQHQYLDTTDLKDAAKSHNTRLGKPTRTTLLRARQRCSSAPVSSYSERRENLLKAEERMERRYSLMSKTGITVRDLLMRTNMQSIHGYLIGARYNRAHCVDIKSYDELGLYLPKDNPNGVCFMTKKEPPSRPVTSREITTQTMTPHPPPGKFWFSWGEHVFSDTPVSCGLQTDLLVATRSAWTNTDAPYATPTETPCEMHSQNEEEVLNVRGTGLSTSQASSARRGRGHRAGSTGPGAQDVTTQRSTSLPIVCGTGMGRTPRNQDLIIDQTQAANQPPRRRCSIESPSPPVPSVTSLLRERSALCQLAVEAGSLVSAVLPENQIEKEAGEGKREDLDKEAGERREENNGERNKDLDNREDSQKPAAQETLDPKEQAKESAVTSEEVAGDRDSGSVADERVNEEDFTEANTAEDTPQTLDYFTVIDTPISFEDSACKYTEKEEEEEQEEEEQEQEQEEEGRVDEYITDQLYGSLEPDTEDVIVETSTREVSFSTSSSTARRVHFSEGLTGLEGEEEFFITFAADGEGDGRAVQADNTDNGEALMAIFSP